MTAAPRMPAPTVPRCLYAYALTGRGPVSVVRRLVFEGGTRPPPPAEQVRRGPHLRGASQAGRRLQSWSARVAGALRERGACILARREGSAPGRRGDRDWMLGDRRRRAA